MICATLFLFGCGAVPATTTSSTSTQPTCAQVAAHLVELAMKDNGATSLPDNMRGVQATYERQCADEKWPPDRRACLAGAGDEEATLRCSP
jgi:hypothetical protein